MKVEIAQELGELWIDIERQLYSDVIDFQALQTFRVTNPRTCCFVTTMLPRSRPAFIEQTRMTIVARRDFRTILRHVKFARLMFVSPSPLI